MEEHVGRNNLFRIYYYAFWVKHGIQKTEYTAKKKVKKEKKSEKAQGKRDRKRETRLVMV